MLTSENYNAELQAVLAQAMDIAKSLNHTMLQTTHVLIALLEVEEGPVSEIFHGMRTRTRREIIEMARSSMYGRYPTAPKSIRYEGSLDRALDQAARLAFDNGRKEVGCEHLLYGLASTYNTTAQKILANAGIAHDLLKRKVNSLDREARRYAKENRTPSAS